MSEENIKALVQEIEDNILSTNIEGAKHDEIEKILKKVVDTTNDTAKSRIDIEKLKTYLYRDLIMLVQEADCLILENKKEELIGDTQDDLLINISMINNAIKIIEKFIDIYLKTDEVEIENERLSIDSVSPPKRIIISNDVKKALEKVPVEERKQFHKTYNYIINGGIYEKDVKHYTKSNDKNLAGIYAYRSYQARIYAYPVVDDIVYVFYAHQKKADWTKDLQKTIADKKPKKQFLDKLVEELTEEEIEKRFETTEGKKGKYTLEQEEFERIIGFKKDMKSDDNINIYGNLNSKGLKKDGLNVINLILNTDYDMQSIEEKSYPNVSVKQTVYDRLLSIINSSIEGYEYSISYERENESTEIEVLFDKLQKITSIENVILEMIKDYIINKEEISEEDEIILNLEVNNKPIDQDILLKSPLPTQKKRGIVRKEIRRIENRLYCYLNMVKNELTELQEIEYRLKELKI
ncbi:MAG: hypothetical protein IKJ43_03910 [Bacilli bacterium]|nr:hypothetical protein [Bacilli bacterium]